MTAGDGDRRFRLGLAGAGRMGRTHLAALAGSRQVRVTGLAEPDPATRAAAARPGLPGFATVAELVAAGNLDGVLVAAPTSAHSPIVTEIAAAGLPVLCEKPCGLDTAQAQVCAAAAARAGVLLQVAYWRRFVPELAALRQRIRAGELGRVLAVNCYQWDEAPPGAGFRGASGGIFADMGVHEFDQVRWLSGQDFGEITAVAGPLGTDPDDTSGDPDSAQAMARLSGGATAFVSLGRYFPGGDMARVEVFGTRDAVRSDFLDPKDGEQAQLDALLRQAEGFAAFARGGPQTGASIHDAVAALDAAERASTAMERSRASAVGAAS
jgi:myo-inositol 2-dehydrogenase/D-chiro-inositol 1-dehydrogenase